MKLRELINILQAYEQSGEGETEIHVRESETSHLAPSLSYMSDGVTKILFLPIHMHALIVGTRIYLSRQAPTPLTGSLPGVILETPTPEKEK